MNEGLAWGLALIIFFRPWRDGLTFKTDNIYYLWAIAFFFALYLARMLMQGRGVRFPRYIALATAFPLVALVLSPATIQVDSTYRTLLIWAGHIALFMMVADGLRTRLAFNIVLGAFLVTSFIEAFWSILHLWYALPELRRMINENPNMLVEYFGAKDLTPLLRDRLESNRAFGRFLFPNALAAFLIVGIPYVAAAVGPAIRDFRSALRSATEVSAASEEKRLHHAALIGLLAWFIAFVIAALLYPFFLYHWTRDSNWLGHPVQCVVFIGIVPIAVAAAPYVLARFRGAAACGMGVRAVFMPLLLATQCLSLYLTFSRGGVLALGASMGLGVVFLLLAWKGKLTRWRLPAAVIVLIGAIALGHAGPSWGQAVPEAPPATQANAAPSPVDGGPGPATLAGEQALDTGGRDLTTGDIANPASFYLRVTYWKVALRMAKDYWLTGLGLGNFSTAYPVYQYLGAGDVQAAHNDYLQYLCETGIFGLMAFLAFWAYLFINGARRVLAVDDRREQVYLTAMLAGVLAFLVHALVDFPFINPSLAFFEYLMAGLFVARIGLTVPERSGVRRYRVVAGILLVVTAFVVGASMRVFFSDYVIGGRALLNVGNARVLGQRKEAADLMLNAVKDANKKPRQALPIGQMYAFIPSLELLQSFGEVRVLVDGGRSTRPPTENEAVPPNSLYFITNPLEARSQGLKFTQIWLDDLTQLDKLYPYNSELALYLVGMYRAMLDATPDQQAKLVYAMKALDWAKNAIERNPMQSVCWQYYGLALVSRANIEASEKSLDYYNQMLDAYKKATELYPTGWLHWYQYSSALKQIGELVSKIDPQRAAKLLEESKEAHEKGEHIEKVRAELGM